MKLDDFDVAVGDTIYDLQRGPAVVTGIDEVEGITTAKTSTGFQVLFNGEGRRVGADNRMVYWQPPIILAPVKDTVSWAAIRGPLQQLAELASSFVGHNNG